MALKDVAYLGTLGDFVQRVMAALINYCLATVNAEVANDQQTITITGSPTGGSFTLGGGPLTGAVAPAWNDTAQALAARLQAALAAGNSCVCTGGPLPGTPVVVTWTGNLANSPQLALTINANNLTGGSTPTPTISNHSLGVAVVNHSSRATLSGKILASPQSYAVTIAPGVANDANVQADYVANHDPTQVTDAHINSAVGSLFNSYI